MVAAPTKVKDATDATDTMDAEEVSVGKLILATPATLRKRLAGG